MPAVCQGRQKCLRWRWIIHHATKQHTNIRYHFITSVNHFKTYKSTIHELLFSLRYECFLCSLHGSGRDTWTWSQTCLCKPHLVHICIGNKPFHHELPLPFTFSVPLLHFEQIVTAWTQTPWGRGDLAQVRGLRGVIGRGCGCLLRLHV